MTDSMSDNQLPYVSLEQALANIVDSISKEETAVASILSAEGEMIQKAKSSADNVEDYIALNISVNDIMKNAVRMQMLLQINNEETQRFSRKIGDIDEIGE